MKMKKQPTNREIAAAHFASDGKVTKLVGKHQIRVYPSKHAAVTGVEFADGRNLPLADGSVARARDRRHPHRRAPQGRQGGVVSNSERLTDAELDEALAVAQSMHSLRLTAAIAELKERRAEDLTDDEVEVLRYLRDRWTRTLAVLDKLLAGRSR